MKSSAIKLLLLKLLTCAAMFDTIQKSQGKPLMEKELGRTLASDFDVIDSEQCLNQCLKQDKVFCEEYSWVTPGARGVCCEPTDVDC